MTYQIEQLSSLAKPSKCWAIASAIVASEKTGLFSLSIYVVYFLGYLKMAKNDPGFAYECKKISLQVQISGALGNHLATH
jgi:hypothetical protein